MMRDYDTLARRVIRCLLDDAGPVPAFTEEELGPWHDSVAALREAYAEGGAGAVHQVFIALARRQPGLIHLVAGGDAAHKTVWTAAELFATDLPPPVFVVDELLPRGLSILAGPSLASPGWLCRSQAQWVMREDYPLVGPASYTPPRGRYCSASARCSVRISASPARSAMVLRQLRAPGDTPARSAPSAAPPCA